MPIKLLIGTYDNSFLYSGTLTVTHVHLKSHAGACSDVQCVYRDTSRACNAGLQASSTVYLQFVQ